MTGTGFSASDIVLTNGNSGIGESGRREFRAASGWLDERLRELFREPTSADSGPDGQAARTRQLAAPPPDLEEDSYTFARSRLRFQSQLSA
jgi:hypothetical protein